MTEKLYNIMNWADVEEICYAESSEPKRILGAHLIPEGLLIQVYIPTAKNVEVRLEGKKVQMEIADESGFFAVLVSAKPEWKKKLPPYKLYVTYDNDTSALIEDPYRFDSAFTDEERRKFTAGNFYAGYRRMGAHPMVLDGVIGTEFAVWAPNAMRVSVVGPFNLWDGRRHMMNRLGDSGIFELFIPGLREGDLYKYEIRRHGEESKLRTDPYAFGYELRPHDACIIRNPDSFTWTDEEWLKKRSVSHPKEEAVSVYQLDLGSFERNSRALNEDGTEVNGSEFLNYRELAPKVAGYVKKLGFTHVELLPITEHPEDWAENDVTGFFAPTSRFGSLADFQYFVNELHKDGIGVILDYVPWIFLPKDQGLSLYDGTALYEDPDPNRSHIPGERGLVFNFRRNEVSGFLVSSVIYWAEVCHIDAFRMVHIEKILYLDYGRQGQNAPRNMYGGNENLDAVNLFRCINTEVHKHFPGVQMICEENAQWPGVTSSPEEDGLGFDLKWNDGAMDSFLQYMETDPFFRKNSYQNLTMPMVYNYTEDYALMLPAETVSGGKGSLLARMPGQTFEIKALSLRAFYGFLLAYPGKKLLFMGQEFGQYDEWNTESSIEWNLLEYPVHSELQSFVRDLNELYRNNPALWRFDYYPDGFEWVNDTYQDLSIITFLRKTDKPEETLLIVSNFDNIAHPRFRIGVPMHCAAQALLSSDDRKYGGLGIVRRTKTTSDPVEWDERPESIEVEIPAMSTTIYRLMPLQKAAGRRNGRSTRKV